MIFNPVVFIDFQFPDSTNGPRRLYDRKNFLMSSEPAVSSPLADCAQYYVAGEVLSVLSKASLLKISIL